MKPLARIFWSATLCLLALLFAVATARADPPGAALTGVIHSKDPITKLLAVDRAWADPLAVCSGADDPFVYPGSIDARGHFTVGGLLAGRTYDLIAFTAAGRWEGVDLRYHRPVRPAGPATDDDKSWISNFVVNTPAFTDKNRVLFVAADHGHAAVLVELKRTTDFHAANAGDVIYRVELWYFENLFGGWAKDKNTEQVISRYRGPAAKLPAPWQYVPVLGGFDIPAGGRTDALDLKLPDAPSPRHGVCP